MSHVSLEIWGSVEARAESSIERLVGFERIASLGVKRLCVPVDAQTDWDTIDRLFRGLRGNNVRPVVALSGPSPDLAPVARDAARRYPWIADFSVPLRADGVAAVRDAMTAIRTENSNARVIVRTRLAKSYAPSHFAQRAALANDRHVLPLDLLCGARADQSLACKPDLIDFEYDVTNERWLDSRGEIDAVRICVESIAGAAELLAQMWRRYGLPMGITSTFAGTGEQQLRWLRDLNRDVSDLRSGGADVRVLCLPAVGLERPAAFDVRAQQARETAIAGYTRYLTQKTTVVSPAASGRGWWRLPSRIQYSPTMREAQPARIPFVERAEPPRPIVIAGTEDPLARVVASACRNRGLAYELWPESMVNSETFAAKLVTARAWAVFDCTGADRAWRSELADGEMRLAEHFGVVAHACRQAGLPIVAISSPLVFDGRSFDRTEADATHPATPRGVLYVEIEELLKIVVPKSLVLRCGIPFGGATRLAWHDAALFSLLQGSRACIFSDYVSAVHRDDLAKVALDLLIDGERGIVHAFNPGESNAVEILDAALRRLRNGAKIERIVEASNRHRYMLKTTRIAPLRPLDDALAEWTQAALRLESAS